MTSQDRRDAWPALPLDAWRDSYATLHLYSQIVGKTRLALAPMQNHWWQVALYPAARGLTTGAMPCGERTLDVTFDFLAHALVIRTSDDKTRSLPLVARPVADFYAEYGAALRALGVEAPIHGVPCEVVTAIPFADDRVHASYDPDAAQRHWRILLAVARVLETYRSSFVGKASPVHFFWGSFDLATTRFSGRGAPRHRGGAPNCPDYVMVEAYSHECASFGFWPGGGAVTEAAFYAYTYPEPAGFAQRPILPSAARYDDDLREFILPYEAVRAAERPDDTLLAFLQSTYAAAANRASWDRAALER